MADTDAQINFDAAAVLTKWPSLNDESIAGEIALMVKAPLANAYGNSRRNLCRRLICMKFTPLRRVN